MAKSEERDTRDKEFSTRLASASMVVQVMPQNLTLVVRLPSQSDIEQSQTYKPRW